MISEKNFFVKSFETFLLRNCYNSLFINYIKGLQDEDGGKACCVCGFTGCERWYALWLVALWDAV